MKRPPPSKKIDEEQLQLNRTFDSYGELAAYVEAQYKGYRIGKTWEVVHIHCIIVGKGGEKEVLKKKPPKIVMEAQSKIESLKSKSPPQSLKDLGLKPKFVEQKNLL